MECDQCGARRPRTGPCPECGAPPPGGHSSMRQWRDQARTGEGPAYGQARGSGANWTPAGGGGGRPRGSGANWGAGGQNAWDEGDGYDEPPAGRSSNRNRRRSAADYEEVDLERALVPTRGDMLPMDPSMAASGVPGMPTTDEEERALGIRRPAYIPATGEKRTRKLGTWRVVSGVLSVMLVCVASCGLAGLFGHNLFAQFGGPITARLTPPAISTQGVPATPVSTAGLSAKFVTNAVTATYVDNRGFPVEPTSHFTVGSTVWVAVSVRNIPDGQAHTISVRWFLQGVQLDLKNADTTQTVKKNAQVYFSLTYPSPGVGIAKIYFDRPSTDTGDNPNDPALAQTIYFAVLEPSGTATPGTQTPHASTGSSPVAWRADLASAS